MSPPPPALSFQALLAGQEVLAWRGDLLTLVVGASYDSRLVEPGQLFIAMRGARADGHAHLLQAVQRGAVALLVEVAPDEVPPGPAVIQVRDSRAALASLARVLYRDPSAGLRLVGVTGTNGKTTVAHLLESLLTVAGRRAGVIGTLGYHHPAGEGTTPNTTPESLDLQRIFREMADASVSSVALEVSSHGLAAHRVDGLHFEARLFCNMGRDHLDLHGTMEAYYQAKRSLFLEFSGGSCWTNLDDPWGERLRDEVPGCLGFSAAGRADAELRVVEASHGPKGVQARVQGPWGLMELHSPLIGRFNLENLLTVIAAGTSLGLDKETLERGIPRARGAPGRVQRVPDPHGEIEVFVDYAHTPDALARVLDELRCRARARLIVLFGCGGERDHGKRAEMGAVAAHRADLLVITDDNPRGEDSGRIIEEILKGVPRQTATLIEADRARAIRTAIAQAGPGDVVLLAGKGHEFYQERKGLRIQFFDLTHAQKALAGRGSGS